MSLVPICSGSFHQLRNNIQNSSHVKLLKWNARLICRKLLDHRSYEQPHLTTRVETLQAKCVETISWHSTNLDPCTTKIRPLIHKSRPLELHLTSERKIERPATILVFDIETTGFIHKSHRIIEFALRDLSGGKNSTFETLVNPERAIPIHSKSVHGISSNLVCRPDVPRFNDLLPLLLTFVRSRQAPGKPVLWVAHNARTFDVPFLAQEFRRCSAEIPADWLFMDTLSLARKLVKSDGSKLRPINLKALREHYDIPLVGPAHRAMQDVTTLCHVFREITFDLKLTHEELMNTAFRASDITNVSKLRS